MIDSPGAHSGASSAARGFQPSVDSDPSKSVRIGVRVGQRRVGLNVRVQTLWSMGMETMMDFSGSMSSSPSARAGSAAASLRRSATRERGWASG